MNEEVLAGLIGGDESEALLVAEPLHSACWHAVLRCLCRVRGGCCFGATTYERLHFSPASRAGLTGPTVAAIGPRGGLCREIRLLVWLRRAAIVAPVGFC